MRGPSRPSFACHRLILRETYVPSPTIQPPSASLRPVAPPPVPSCATSHATETPHFQRPKASRTTQRLERASQTVSVHRSSACPTGERFPHRQPIPHHDPAA